MENKTLYAVIEGGPILAEFDLSQLTKRTTIPLIAASILPKGVNRKNILTEERFWIPAPGEYIGTWREQVQAEIEYEPETQQVTYHQLKEPILWAHIGPHLQIKKQTPKYGIGNLRFGPKKEIQKIKDLQGNIFSFPEDTQTERYNIPIGKTLSHFSLRRTSRIKELEELIT